MIVIDIRNGRTVLVGQTMIHDADGSYQIVSTSGPVEARDGRWWYRLVSVADWGLRARVKVHTVDGVRTRWIAVGLRKTPFGRQRVAVYPS